MMSECQKGYYKEGEKFWLYGKGWSLFPEIIKEDKMKSNRPTREDLKIGADNWQWRAENPGVDHASWPRYEELSGHFEGCCFCTYYKAAYQGCPTCPLSIKFGVNCFDKKSLFYKWNNTFRADHLKRSYYASQIAMVFAEELEKLGEEKEDSALQSKKVYPSEPEIFFPKPGRRFYYYMTAIHSITVREYVKHDANCEALIALGVYRTREDCERAVEIQKAKVRIIKWRQENSRPILDSNDPHESKWCVDYVMLEGTPLGEIGPFRIYRPRNAKTHSPIGYFATKADLERCIEANRADFLTVWGVEDNL
jgi:hypothetical protein